MAFNLNVNKQVGKINLYQGMTKISLTPYYCQILLLCYCTYVKVIDKKKTLYSKMTPWKYHVFENIMENEAFALLEQMFNFP